MQQKVKYSVQFVNVMSASGLSGTKALTYEKNIFTDCERTVKGPRAYPQ